MKKHTTLLSFILVLILALFTFAGCTTTDTTETVDPTAPDTTAVGPTDPDTTTDFTFSDGIDDNGFWENITALDHVQLCEYDSISIPSDIHEITDEAIQREIDTILANYASDGQVTDRPVADGDTVNIDYVGSIDGVEFDGGSTSGTGTNVTIGVTSYIDDFLEQLIGHNPGESLDIEVTFPEDYGQENLNGKDAVFAATINYIVEAMLPELTDEFVLNNLSSDYGWSTITEMEAGIRSGLQSSAMLSYVQEYIVQNTNIISLPEALLEYQKNSMISYYQGYAESYSMDIEEFLSSYVGVATIDELIQANIANMTETAKFPLIIQAIAEDASISVSDEDVAAYVKKYAGADDYSGYEENYGMPYLKLITLSQAVTDYLVDNAVLE
ncbi:MAG: FKBP-type peptidyl-prolyl cis-trans isomerase [Dehalococcoidia bacterium]|nr:FKBP-type peptidyl-prolyl cis-trans isomerase [Dehalococcoidia bacterium]